MSYVVGIESSCDDTSVAIIDLDGRLIANETIAQTKLHAAFGGVVPEVASRNHILNLQEIFIGLLARFSVELSQVVAVCATGGPGLLGGLIVGVMFAKGLALSLGVPFIAVNHLEAHLLSAKLEHGDFDFPFLGLLVSGGNTQIVIASGLGSYKLLGKTLDDAAGEAFDKTARMIGIEYPGGAKIDELAKMGRGRFKISIPMRGSKTLDMSFSGLKTNIRRLVEQELKNCSVLNEETVCDFAFGIQNSIATVLEDKMRGAIELYMSRFPDYRRVVTVCGGVGANSEVRKRIKSLCDEYGFSFVSPSPKYCADNAGMIALAGLLYFKRGFKSDIDFKPLSRWDVFQPNC